MESRYKIQSEGDINAVAELPLELRVKRIKYLGDLELKYLHYLNDRTSVIERYLKGDIHIHLHGNIGGATPMNRFFCLTLERPRDNGACVNRGDIDSDETIRIEDSESLVFVGVRDFPERLRPVATIARLQRLNNCLVFDRHAFEVARLQTSLPPLWLVFDRKLRALLSLARVKKGQFENEIIKRGAQIVDAFPDKDAQSRRYLDFTQINMNRPVPAYRLLNDSTSDRSVSGTSRFKLATCSFARLTLA